MAGITFVKTKSLDEISKFYIEKIGMKHWLSQPDVEILRHENMLIGFHEQKESSKDVLFTFFYGTQDEVDTMYFKIKEISKEAPKKNSTYNIYNFFAKDPEGRIIEFQSFLHKIPDY